MTNFIPGTVLSRIALSWHDGGGAKKLEGVAPGHGAPLAGHRVGLGVATLAHDLHVRGVAAEEGVQRTLAVAAGEAALELKFRFYQYYLLVPCCMRYEGKFGLTHFVVPVVH